MRILLAIDSSSCSKTAVEALAHQFRTDNTEIHVLHAIDWPHSLPDCFSFGEGPEFAREFKEFLDKERSQAREMTNQTAGMLSQAGFHSIPVVVECDPRKAILDYSTRWNPDLIILGSHGRTGIERIVLGSVSEAVARHAHCSVQIMRTPAA